MKYLRILVVLVSLCTLLPATGFAGSSKKKTPAAPLIQTPTIAAVTADSITIKEAQVTKTLGITQFTEINVNGRKATVAELKPGMSVNVTLGTDPSKASRISATEK
jgi:hypothetical protein